MSQNGLVLYGSTLVEEGCGTVIKDVRRRERTVVRSTYVIPCKTNLRTRVSVSTPLFTPFELITTLETRDRGQCIPSFNLIF